MNYQSESLGASDLKPGAEELKTKEKHETAVCRFAEDDRIRRMPRFGRTPWRDTRRLDIAVPSPIPKPAVPIDRKQPGLSATQTPTSAPVPSGSSDITPIPTPPTHRVEGRVRFEYRHRGPDILSSASNEDFPQYAAVAEKIQKRTLRWATVVLEDDCGHYLEGELSSEGEFQFYWSPVNCEKATITVWSVVHNGKKNAAVGRWVGGNISHENQLTAETSDYRAYSFVQSFLIADATIGSGGIFLNILVKVSEETARAFWLLENALDALNYFYQIPEVWLMPKLNIVYTPGLQLIETAAYYPDKDPGFIYIPASPVDFGWIGFAVRHEASHCFQTHYMRDHNYGRIGEALANVQAQAMVGSSWMDQVFYFEDLDVQANFTNGAFRLEDKDGEYWEYSEGCPWTSSYGWVQRVLWDLVDGVQSEPLSKYFPHNGDELFQPGEFDLIDGGGGNGGSKDGADHLLNDVLLNYLGGGPYGNESENYVDRGFPKVDIVDVLDGMICRGHATVEQIDQLVNHAMKFGYIPNGPTSCE